MKQMQTIAGKLKITQFSNEAELLKKVNPDLFRIYRAIKVIEKYGGHGSIEVHFVRGKIRINNGLYIKPGFNDDGK